MEAIGKQEKMDASEADIEEEMKKWQVAKEKINLETLRDMIKRRKTYDFIVSHAKIK